ncbi:MAG: OmpW family protein [Alphaproteobacteria bacterium HGW-Alphaproteobacteria-3]|nr:MAG: OmpW family protein [Alphaproteobacteria bacterium HGW-Alphaproteobacteria-3]
MKTERKMGAGVAAVALGVMMAGMAAAPAQAEFQGKSAGDFMVRLRAIGVLPDESASTSIGGDVNVSNDWVPEIDFTYFVTDNIALELIAATTNHDVSHTAGIDLGEVNLLPPTLTLQYHFMPKERLSPYIGAGLNYTFFYDEDAPGGAVTSINYDNNIGYALQAGVDYAVADNWYLNLDVKKIFLSTDVSINGGAITADVDLDPWVVGFGVGYRF